MPEDETTRPVEADPCSDAEGAPDASDAEGSCKDAENCSGDGACKGGEDTKSEQAAPRPVTDPRDLRIKFLEKKLSDNETTLHGYIRAHKKAEAEFDAYKTRLKRDQEQELQRAKGKVVGRLLDIDENLERTIEAVGRGGTVDSVLDGVKLIHKMFVDRLVELGLERVDPSGEVFDPSSMEALGVVAVTDPAQDNTVVNVFRAGYRFGDVEIRPAMVQVGRKM